MTPLETSIPSGSLDGTGCGDHDLPYRFGRRPRAIAPYPFSTSQYARLLIVRGRLQDGLFGTGDLAAERSASSMLRADQHLKDRYLRA
jgi:hypothetical protein